MDLHNGTVTLGQLLQNPKVQQLLEREMPGLLKSPMLRRFEAMSLRQALSMLRGKIPATRLAALVRELEEL